MTLPAIMYLCFLAVMNVVLFVLMGYDKARAKKEQWRISESTLFLLGVLGGGPLGLVGMKAFRHKTRKPLFYIFFVIGIAGIAVVLYLLFSNGLFFKPAA
ncbi:MAG: DUF1294 domain-containing protein [Firmicutes bacterium]|nr:DUF1294 domain-containing protein [Bacillota bacterium]